MARQKTQRERIRTPLLLNKSKDSKAESAKLLSLLRVSIKSVKAVQNYVEKLPQFKVFLWPDVKPLWSLHRDTSFVWDERVEETNSISYHNHKCRNTPVHRPALLDSHSLHGRRSVRKNSGKACSDSCTGKAYILKRKSERSAQPH